MDKVKDSIVQAQRCIPYLHLPSFAQHKYKRVDARTYEGVYDPGKRKRVRKKGDKRQLIIKLAAPIDDNVYNLQIHELEQVLIQDEVQWRQDEMERRKEHARAAIQKKEDALKDAMKEVGNLASGHGMGKVQGMLSLQKDIKTNVKQQFDALEEEAQGVHAVESVDDDDDDEDDDSVEDDEDGNGGEDHGGAVDISDTHSNSVLTDGWADNKWKKKKRKKGKKGVVADLEAIEQTKMRCPEAPSVIVQVVEPCVIRDLKIRIQSLTQIGPERQRLAYKGYLLKDDMMVPQQCIDVGDEYDDTEETTEEGEVEEGFGSPTATGKKKGRKAAEAEKAAAVGGGGGMGVHFLWLVDMDTLPDKTDGGGGKRGKGSKNKHRSSAVVSSPVTEQDLDDAIGAYVNGDMGAETLYWDVLQRVFHENEHGKRRDVEDEDVANEEGADEKDVFSKDMTSVLDMVTALTSEEDDRVKELREVCMKRPLPKRAKHGSSDDDSDDDDSDNDGKAERREMDKGKKKTNELKLATDELKLATDAFDEGKMGADDFYWNVLYPKLGDALKDSLWELCDNMTEDKASELMETSRKPRLATLSPKGDTIDRNSSRSGGAGGGGGTAQGLKDTVVINGGEGGSNGKARHKNSLKADRNRQRGVITDVEVEVATKAFQNGKMTTEDFYWGVLDKALNGNDDNSLSITLPQILSALPADKAEELRTVQHQERPAKYNEFTETATEGKEFSKTVGEEGDASAGGKTDGTRQEEVDGIGGDGSGGGGGGSGGSGGGIAERKYNVKTATKAFKNGELNAEDYYWGTLVKAFGDKLEKMLPQLLAMLPANRADDLRKVSESFIPEKYRLEQEQQEGEEKRLFMENVRKARDEKKKVKGEEGEGEGEEKGGGGGGKEVADSATNVDSNSGGGSIELVLAAITTKSGKLDAKKAVNAYKSSQINAEDYYWKVLYELHGEKHLKANLPLILKNLPTDKAEDLQAVSRRPRPVTEGNWAGKDANKEKDSKQRGRKGGGGGRGGGGSKSTSYSPTKGGKAKGKRTLASHTRSVSQSPPPGHPAVGRQMTHVLFIEKVHKRHHHHLHHRHGKTGDHNSTTAMVSTGGGESQTDKQQQEIDLRFTGSMEFYYLAVTDMPHLKEKDHVMSLHAAKNDPYIVLRWGAGVGNVGLRGSTSWGFDDDVEENAATAATAAAAKNKYSTGENGINGGNGGGGGGGVFGKVKLREGEVIQEVRSSVLKKAGAAGEWEKKEKLKLIVKQTKQLAEDDLEVTVWNDNQHDSKPTDDVMIGRGYLNLQDVRASKRMALDVKIQLTSPAAAIKASSSTLFAAPPSSMAGGKKKRYNFTDSKGGSKKNGPLPLPSKMLQAVTDNLGATSSNLSVTTGNASGGGGGGASVRGSYHDGGDGNGGGDDDDDGSVVGTGGTVTMRVMFRPPKKKPSAQHTAGEGDAAKAQASAKTKDLETFDQAMNAGGADGTVAVDKLLRALEKNGQKLTSAQVQVLVSKKLEDFDLRKELRKIGCEVYTDVLVEAGFGSRGAYANITEEDMTSYPLYIHKKARRSMVTFAELTAQAIRRETNSRKSALDAMEADGSYGKKYTMDGQHYYDTMTEMNIEWKLVQQRQLQLKLEEQRQEEHARLVMIQEHLEEQKRKQEEEELFGPLGAPGSFGPTSLRFTARGVGGGVGGGTGLLSGSSSSFHKHDVTATAILTTTVLGLTNGSIDFAAIATKNSGDGGDGGGVRGDTAEHTDMSSLSQKLPPPPLLTSSLNNGHTSSFQHGTTTTTSSSISNNNNTHHNMRSIHDKTIHLATTTTADNFATVDLDTTTKLANTTTTTTTTVTKMVSSNGMLIPSRLFHLPVGKALRTEAQLEVYQRIERAIRRRQLGTPIPIAFANDDGVNNKNKNHCSMDTSHGTGGWCHTIVTNSDTQTNKGLSFAATSAASIRTGKSFPSASSLLLPSSIAAGARRLTSANSTYTSIFGPTSTSNSASQNFSSPTICCSKHLVSLRRSMLAMIEAWITDTKFQMELWFDQLDCYHNGFFPPDVAEGIVRQVHKLHDLWPRAFDVWTVLEHSTVSEDEDDVSPNITTYALLWLPWYDMVWYGSYGMVWYGMRWSYFQWCDMVWANASPKRYDRGKLAEALARLVRARLRERCGLFGVPYGEDEEGE